jgi:4-hydroxy-tetrahydrodipicolinate reductase
MQAKEIRMNNVKVIIWGFGAMGTGMARMLAKKKGIDIVGVCDHHQGRPGREIHDYLGIDRGSNPSVIIKENMDDVLKEGSCDVILCTTDSFVKKAFPRLKYCLEKKVNVISTAEEMAFPAASNPELASELDKIARENGVSILGTGINPGLIMDLLVIMMTGCMTDVEHIEAKRVNSLSPFGPAVMREQGVGVTKDQFDKAVSEGTMAGHVGFHESISMIATALGWKVENFEQQILFLLLELAIYFCF